MGLPPLHSRNLQPYLEAIGQGVLIEVFIQIVLHHYNSVALAALVVYERLAVL